MNAPMKKFNTVLKDLKSLKIQGAKNVAVEATKSLGLVLKTHPHGSKLELIRYLEAARKKLFSTRPTEPAMRNAVSYVVATLRHCENPEAISAEVSMKIKKVLSYFEEAEKKIVSIGSHKIRNGMIVYTHCHSSAVMKILIQAKKDGKKFVVHNTETRPSFQGRITAKELAKNGIHVVHFVDSAARLALKKADLFLIGADAITSEGKIVNKVGSELFAEAAENYSVPVYVCSHAWKFDPRTVFGFDEEIEKREAKEIWAKPPKNVEISNFAFEQVNPDRVSGIISELGIYKPQLFVVETKKRYPWMFIE